MPQTAKHTLRAFRKAAGQALYICIAAALLGLLVNALRPEGLALIRFEAQPDASKVVREGPQTIEPAAALAELKNKTAIFIDARPEDDYRAGHIQTARNLQERNLDIWMPAFFEKTPPDARLILYCSGPRCHLAERLAKRLQEFGYTHTRVLTAGWQAWLNSGYPTETGAVFTAGQSLEQTGDCNAGECNEARMSSDEPGQSQ